MSSGDKTAVGIIAVGFLIGLTGSYQFGAAVMLFGFAYPFIHNALNP